MSAAMWLVIGIVSIWAIMKRKSKRKKNLKSCTIIFFLFSQCFIPNAKGQNSKLCIYGSISAAQLKGDVYVDFKL
jgi:ABC-type Co2+ transport system permease subunit